MYHSSIEGAQHGPKGLKGFAEFAADASAMGIQPSNFMLEDGRGGFLPVSEIRSILDNNELRLDGISAHCPFWIHGTAWTGSKTIRPFLPASVAQMSSKGIEEWAEDYILRLFDLAGELDVRIMPMFWGVYFGWELATGYPWGFYSGADYDLVKEGRERFVYKTRRLREEASSRGIYLAHEIHPGTAAACADDFLMLVDICDGDDCVVVNADPSHCWEGEDWETRFRKVGDYVYGCHVKNHRIRPGLPLRSMQPDWKKRPMQFTDLPSGDINLTRYVEVMYDIGYPQRYCKVAGVQTAPLVTDTEAESAYRDLDETARDAIRFTNDFLCIQFATQSFEEGMGVADETSQEEKPVES